MATTEPLQELDFHRVAPTSPLPPSLPKHCGMDFEDPMFDTVLFNRSLIIAVLSVGGLFWNTVFSMVVSGRESSAISTSAQASQIGVTVLTALVIYFIAEAHHVEERRALANVNRTTTTTRKGSTPPMFRFKAVISTAVECAIHVPHSLPFLANADVSKFFSFVMFARLYTLLRPIGYIHTAYRLRFDIFGTGANQKRFPIVRIKWQTMIKMWFLEHTAAVFVCCTVVAIFCCSFGVYVAENGNTLSNELFSDFNMCVWFVVVSATTIGYGDMVPATHIGKISAIAAGFIGVVLANMVAAILAIQFSRTPAQNEIANFLARRTQKQRVETRAASCIMRFLRVCCWARRRGITFLTSSKDQHTHNELVLFLAELVRFRKERQLLEQISSEDGQNDAEMSKLMGTSSDIVSRVSSLQSKALQHQEALREYQRANELRVVEMKLQFQESVNKLEQRVSEVESTLICSLVENQTLCERILAAVDSSKNGASTSPERPNQLSQASLQQQMARLNVTLAKLAQGQETLLSKIT